MKKLFTVLLALPSLCRPLTAQPVPPAALLASTYLGGSGINYTTDVGYSVAVDGDGAVSVLGQTSSEPFPHTAVIGGFDTGYGTFVTKLSADGKTLAYSTFISGVAGRALAVDAQGSVYLTGETGGSLPGISSAQVDLDGPRQRPRDRGYAGQQLRHCARSLHRRQREHT